MYHFKQKFFFKMQLNELYEIIYHNLPEKFQIRIWKFPLLILFVSIFWQIILNNNVKTKSKTGPIKKLSDTTIGMFDDVKNIAANTIMEQHGIDCRKVASMIQRSPAFEHHGCQIATGLRKFKEETIEVNQILQKMYSKGSKLYETLDEKIVDMINQFKGQKKGETKYFKEGI